MPAASAVGILPRRPFSTSNTEQLWRKNEVCAGPLKRTPGHCRMTAMRSLFAKILLAQVTAVVLALLVVVIITRASLDRGFIVFIERQERAVLEHVAPTLGELYAERGGWDFLRDEPHSWLHVLHEARPQRSEAGARCGSPR